MIAAHTAAMLALLEGDDAPPALVVLDGKVPSGVVAPYVLVYFATADPELAESRPLTGSSQRHVTRAYAHCVGLNGLASRMVADRVRTAWLDVVPAVAGRQCMPIRREEGVQAERDEAIGAIAIDTVEVYRLESVPA
ncbi:hypothetical protein ACFP2T_16475 [Plantactinospora solaniradicis]|uniref:DUF3168 domain-containing protein n=1 Tax=Plantactinospora solaniradicis TaxID=1723736 RepID=A0ABW1KBV5_9ACTN